MAERNISVVTTGKNDVTLEDRRISKPGKYEVKVEMQRVGICGSDVHFMEHGRIGDYVVETSVVLGHEASGIVSEVGDGVTTLKKGDKVALEPGIPCTKCKLCKSGRYHLCKDVVFVSVYPHDGMLRQYHNHVEDFCFKLPDNVSLEEGALMEPLSVAIHACRRANIQLGQNVLVLGSGPIGLVNLLTAKAMGASEVAITDLIDSRLETATKMGASRGIKIDERDPEKMAAKIHDILGWEPDVTIDCTGAANSIQMGIHVTTPGGVMQLIGHGDKVIPIPIFVANSREIDIRGTQRYSNTWPTALSMISSGAVDVKPLVTHTFPLARSEDALRTVQNHADNSIKCMIHCNE